MKKFVLVLAVIMAVVALPIGASAWRGGSHVSVGFGVGGYYPGYYAAPYPYYPPYPAYSYYPPYPPQTVIVQNPQPYGTYAQPAPQGNGYCREFTQNVVINGQPQKTYGTACQQPDGTWQTVSSGNPVQ